MKEAVFPFLRYQGVDIALGPEMKSTGEVMGIDADLGLAYAKSQMAAPPPLPKGGNVFISVKDGDKEARHSAGARIRRARFRDHRDQRNMARRLQAAGIPVHEGFQTSRRPAATCSIA